MRGMVLTAPGAHLELQERPDPKPGDGEIEPDRFSALGRHRADALI
jgi:hypothetical protein